MDYTLMQSLYGHLSAKQLGQNFCVYFHLLTHTRIYVSIYMKLFYLNGESLELANWTVKFKGRELPTRAFQ